MPPPLSGLGKPGRALIPGLGDDPDAGGPGTDEDDEVKAKKPKTKKSTSTGRSGPAAGGPGKTKSKKPAKSATTQKKGGAMKVPDADDLEQEFEAAEQKKCDDENLALEFFKAWRRRPDVEKEAFLRFTTKHKQYKKFQEYLPQEMLDAIDALGDTKGKAKGKAGGKLDAAKSMAETAKAAGKSRREATSELVASRDFDDDTINRAIEEVYA